MKYKKADGWILRILVVAGILLFATTVYIAFFSGASRKGFTDITKEIGLLDDYDKDNVMNRLDRCPCDKTDLGSVANEGCPEGYKIRGDNTGKEDRYCLTKIT
mgnify:CR=1 FL=1